MDYISAIEKKLGKKAIYNMMPLQKGDVPSTSADVSLLEKDLGYRPTTSIETGISNFIDWYKDYYNYN